MQDVVIVGAGPAGIFAACELARHGIRARLLERSLEPHRQARGTALQPATLEVLQRAGVVDKFLATGVHVNHVSVRGPGFVELARDTTEGLDCAFAHECCQPQWQTEDLLRAHLEDLGGSIERGVSVVAVEDEEDHLRIRLERPDGTRESLCARYVIGAGGAHSITRSSMQSRLQGETYAGQYIVADVRVKLELDPQGAAIVVGPKGFVLLAALPDRRRLIFVDVDSERASDAAPSPELVAALVDERVGLAVGVHDVQWTSNFRMNKRIAPVLADGRRFLVGDAGHVSSPLGGEGLNAALQDAADLAWKLALSLQGHARPGLLQSYAHERALAGQHALNISDIIHAKVMGLVQAYAQTGAPPSTPPDPGEARQMQRSKAMVDISYAGSPLVGQYLGPGAVPPEGPGPGERFPGRVALTGTRHHLLLPGGASQEVKAFQSRWGHLIEIVESVGEVPSGGLLLVRPDGYLGFRAIPADAAGLQALESHLEFYLHLSQR